jgi:predicted ATPase with chaperone activity
MAVTTRIPAIAVSTDQRIDLPAPRTIEETGLPADLITTLAAKVLHLGHELTATEISHRLGLAFSVIEPALEALTTQHHAAIVGGALVGRASYRYRITEAGRARASASLADNPYVGPAPVPVSQYRDYMAAFSHTANRKATRARIRQAFSHLVISEDVLDQLGPAINGRHSMFVYGPPGNGKTVISQAIRNVLDGEIAIPHAIEVNGNIIRIFDPVFHEPSTEQVDDAGLDAGPRTDARWVRCRRPMVTVGGELRLESLDLTDGGRPGHYRAPLQTVANGGVLIIDDFGRQQCSPRELLNRWIVPLESRIDYLTLPTGQKLELPFMVLVVFATNLRPGELVDEAFLRRIQHKILAVGPTPDEYRRIFSNYCREEGIPFEPQLVEQLLTSWYDRRNVSLRACHARDLIRLALAMAEYRDEPRILTQDLLERACMSYFTPDEAGRTAA